MEELLPGLLRMMEERLGKFGRPLTTLVVISLALGAIAWGLRLAWDNLVYPLSQVVLGIIGAYPAPTSGLVAVVAVSFTITILFTGLAIIFLRFAVMRPILGAKREAENIVEKGEALLQLTKSLIAQEENKRDGV